MDSIPPEAQIYALITGLTALFFVVSLVRVILLRITENKLLKANEELSGKLETARLDLAATRKDAAEWRAETQRQFDAFRSASETNLGAERQRFDSLLAESRHREQELRASLEAARQMCAELPAAKARILQLESMLAAPAAPKPSKPPAAPKDDDSPGDGEGGTAVIVPIPDLGGAPSSGQSLDEPAPVPLFKLPPASTNPEMEQRLRQLEKQNRSLQNALHLARLKSRAKRRVSAPKKRQPCLSA